MAARNAMIGVEFICRRLLWARYAFIPPKVPTFRFLEDQSRFSSIRYKGSTTDSKKESFTVSYLMNSCGFPLKAALSASNYIQLKTPERPDSVLSFFKELGFSQSQIFTLVKRCPFVLCYRDPRKLLLPKIEFFLSKGMSKADLRKVFSAFPHVITRNLKDQLIPCYLILKNLFGSDLDASAVIKRFPMVLCCSHEDEILPIVAMFKEYGVPLLNIMYLLHFGYSSFKSQLELLKEVSEEVKEIGIDPTTFCFVVAIRAKFMISKTTWERKLKVYRKWGWSEDDFLLAFRKCPCCMIYSEKKIMGAMEVFVNYLGWESSLIARYPQAISFSLEKRIIPRCSVLKILFEKGLVGRSISLHVAMQYSERHFLERFVIPFQKEAPDLLKLYQEKLDD